MPKTTEIQVSDQIATERSEPAAPTFEYVITVETPGGGRRQFTVEADSLNAAQQLGQRGALPGEIVLNFQQAGVSA